MTEPDLYQHPKTGKWYSRNHPHEIISPHVMRFAEIRHWLKELSTNPEYGWLPHGLYGLARALGWTDKNSIREKIEWRWIWPKEQIRLTARIREILDGHIVPTYPKRIGRAGRPRCDGVYTDPPRPPVVHVPRVLKLQASLSGRITSAPGSLVAAPRLPNFSKVFERIRTWDPDSTRDAARLPQSAASLGVTRAHTHQAGRDKKPRGHRGKVWSKRSQKT
jgi:hypothetical protein